MNFECVYKNVKIWKGLIDAIQNVIEQATFLVKQNGLYLYSLDQTKTNFMAIKIPVSAFSNFKINNIEKFTIDLKRFKTILNRAKSDSEMSLQVDKKKGKMMISWRSISGIVKQFSVNLSSEFSEEKPNPLILPEDRFTVKFLIKPEIFLEIVKDVETVSDFIEFHTENNIIIISGHGETLNGSLKIMENGEDKITFIHVNGITNSKYSMESLTNLSKMANISDQIEMSYGSNFPLRLKFELKEGLGSIEYILAPRIEFDEESSSVDEDMDLDEEDLEVIENE